jgi:hypothetical protein
MEQTIEYSTNAWLKDAFNKGVILGIIHILIFLVIYSFLPNKLMGLSYVFVMLCLNLGYGIYHGIQLRKKMGGFLGYGVAFKYSFVLLASNGILNVLFSMIFLFIDPSLPQLMAESQLNTSLYWAQSLGAPESALEQMRDDYNIDEVKERFSFSGLILSFGVGLIFYAIGALIIALIARKQQPETF